MNTYGTTYAPGQSDARARRLLGLLLLGLALALCVCWSLSIGLPEVGLTYAGKFLAGAELPDEIRRIFYDVRLPRVLMAVLAGAGLALAGAGTQAVLCNPLVSPSILGLSAGASFGAGLMILYGGRWFFAYGQPLIIAAAFVMAMLAVLLSYTLAGLRRSSRETVILAGIAVHTPHGGCHTVRSRTCRHVVRM